MRLILCSNILEHDGFGYFLRDVLDENKGAWVLVCGDLLNVFPEPGENLKGSIFYELFGDLIVDGIEELLRTHFKDIENSVFIEPLRQMFLPTGSKYEAAKLIARERYRSFFQRIGSVLREAGHGFRFIYIPGNMDYPRIGASLTDENPFIYQHDQELLEIKNTKLGGIGGIPNNSHPFRNVVEISPYEMHEAEYGRRLLQLDGVHILLAHQSPSETPVLREFLKNSKVELLICRAPFDFNRNDDFRGQLETIVEEGKQVIMVRPFDFPTNHYCVVDLGSFGSSNFKISQHTWHFNDKIN